MNRILAIIAVALSIVGCTDSKSLPGDFSLLKWEDGRTFYLTGPDGANQEGGGAIEGTVIRIAWNKSIIAAERNATFRGDMDGWMIIDVKTKSISGPLSEEQFAPLKMKMNLQIQSANQAWEAL